MRLIAALVLSLCAGCSTGTQKIALVLSAWGVEVGPYIECKDISFLQSPVVVTNMVCECCTTNIVRVKTSD